MDPHLFRVNDCRRLSACNQLVILFHKVRTPSDHGEGDSSNAFI